MEERGPTAGAVGHCQCHSGTAGRLVAPLRGRGSRREDYRLNSLSRCFAASRRWDKLAVWLAASGLSQCPLPRQHSIEDTDRAMEQSTVGAERSHSVISWNVMSRLKTQCKNEATSAHCQCCVACDEGRGNSG